MLAYLEELEECHSWSTLLIAGIQGADHSVYLLCIRDNHIVPNNNYDIVISIVSTEKEEKL